MVPASQLLGRSTTIDGQNHLGSYFYRVTRALLRLFALLSPP